MDFIRIWISRICLSCVISVIVKKADYLLITSQLFSFGREAGNRLTGRLATGGQFKRPIDGPVIREGLNFIIKWFYKNLKNHKESLPKILCVGWRYWPHCMWHIHLLLSSDSTVHNVSIASWWHRNNIEAHLSFSWIEMINRLLNFSIWMGVRYIDSYSKVVNRNLRYSVPLAKLENWVETLNLRVLQHKCLFIYSIKQTVLLTLQNKKLFSPISN